MGIDIKSSVKRMLIDILVQDFKNILNNGQGTGTL
jgi:hypothetical protein